MSDEQRVRTMAGWVGVEISKSRVRTAGKAGYGLYRVRGSRPFQVQCASGVHTDWEPAEWTAYAFTLEEIETEVETAIGMGIPAGPVDLWLRPMDGKPPVGVTTRWTQAYRGRRDRGVGAPFKAGAYVESKPETVRQRQRAYNAAFQAAHKERRKYGLKRRHALKAVWVASQRDGNIAVGNVSGPLSDREGPGVGR